MVKLYFQDFAQTPSDLGEFTEPTITPLTVLSRLQHVGYQFKKIFQISECLHLSQPEKDFSKPSAYYEIQPRETQLVFGWVTQIRVFPATERLKSTNLLKTINFASWGTQSLESFFESAKDFVGGKFITKNQEDLIISSPSFYENPQPTLDIYAVPEKSKYSDCSIISVSSKIRFHRSNGKRRPADESSANIDSIQKGCIKSLERSYPEFSYSERFNDMIQLLTAELETLHKAYTPTDDLCEAGRRLIINIFIANICAFKEKTFKVEDHIFKLESPGELGWGPFDYSFPDNTICKSIVEEVEETNDALEGNFDVEEEFGTESLEAKKIIELRGYCQLAAQLFDVARETERSPVRGILSTGTIWKFFTLYEPSDPTLPDVAKNSTDGRYVMVLEDSAKLDIIKGQTTRRGSARADASLNKEQLKKIAVFLTCFL